MKDGQAGTHICSSRLSCSGMYVHTCYVHRDTCTKELRPNACGTQKTRARVPASWRSRAMLGRARGHQAQLGPVLEQQQKKTGTTSEPGPQDVLRYLVPHFLSAHFAAHGRWEKDTEAACTKYKHPHSEIRQFKNSGLVNNVSLGFQTLGQYTMCLWDSKRWAGTQCVTGILRRNDWFFLFSIAKKFNFLLI